VASRLSVLVVTKGHPFDQASFFEMFDAFSELEWEHAEHPDAQRLFIPANAGRWDAIVRYDLPGIRFHAPQPPQLVPADPAEVDGLRQMLDAGQGTVFLHHVLAGWPAWEGFAEIVGGRFLYQPGMLRGEWWPDSGYRFGMTHRLRAVDPSHPVCQGLPEFELTDEVYLAPVLRGLGRAAVPERRRLFLPTLLLVRTRIAGRAQQQPRLGPPAGLKPGGVGQACRPKPDCLPAVRGRTERIRNPGFRRLLGNAIRWVASPAAHRWAAADSSG
jgi:hypothetical protein